MKYTTDQQLIVDRIFKEINNPVKENIVIQGIGGTGKTLTICSLICDLIERGIKVCAGAETGRATSVLRSKVIQLLEERKIVPEEGQLKIETVAKITVQSKPVDITRSGETKYVNRWRDPRLFDFDILILDEASMLKPLIVEWLHLGNIFTVCCGDFAQLPPVITSEYAEDIRSFESDLNTKVDKNLIRESKFFINILRENSEVELTKVLRSTNHIANLCKELRDFSISEREVIKTIKRYADITENISYSENPQDIEIGDDWQIICYTNKTCASINEQLRTPTKDGYPDLNDKIVLEDNLNNYKLYNGDVLKLSELLSIISEQNAKKSKGGRRYACLKYEGKLPSITSRNPIEKAFAKNYSDYKLEEKRVIAARQKVVQAKISNLDISSTLKEAAQKKFLSSEYSEFLDWLLGINRRAALEIIEKNIELPRLDIANFKLGECITTHKSQGGEFPNVCYFLEKFDRPLLYTGLSRAKEKLKVINLTQYRG